jgi:hypothetical protein
MNESQKAINAETERKFYKYGEKCSLDSVI